MKEALALRGQKTKNPTRHRDRFKPGPSLIDQNRPAYNALVLDYLKREYNIEEHELPTYEGQRYIPNKEIALEAHQYAVRQLELAYA